MYLKMLNEQPDIEPIGHRKYRLRKTFEFSAIFNDIEVRCKIPPGFIYDGISVPVLLWSLTGITPDGIQRAAGLVHDYIYAHKGKVPKGTIKFFDKHHKEFKPTINKYLADDLFIQMLEYYKIPTISRLSMFAFVRLFGWIKWLY